MKIVVLDGYTLDSNSSAWNSLSKYGSVEVYERTPKDEEIIVSRIKDAYAIFVNSTPITTNIISKCPALRFISTLSTGYSGIDISAAQKYGITVCNIPAYSTYSVAQFTFALILELSCRVGKYSKSVFAGEWSACPDFTYPKYPIFELYKKTIGIVGYGNIGSQVASLALSFGMRVLVYSKSKNSACVNNSSIEFTDFDTLLSHSDIISLHTHLCEYTKNIICSETISKMKDGAIIINTSRGQLIDEYSLAEALNTGKLAFAAVDVVSDEPINKHNPLLKAKNIIITPHVAWSSKEAKQRLNRIALDNFESFISGYPINIVV